MTACPHCRSKQIEVITDGEGERVPHCRTCGYYAYKTFEQLGMIRPRSAEVAAHQGIFSHHQDSHRTPNDKTYAEADSGCQRATLVLGRQAKCFECPFKKCLYDMEHARVQRNNQGQLVMSLG